MTRRRIRTLGAVLGGAVFGGSVVFAFLANLGGNDSSDEARVPSPSVLLVSPEPTPTPTPTAAPTPSPVPSTDDGRVVFPDLGVSFVLPLGYRIASTLNAFERARPEAPPKMSLTKATEEQEAAYVRLLGGLRTQTATEAPEFLPGQTIGIARVRGTSDETFSRQIAKETTPVVSASGLKGTRYRRVEGLYTYDSTFFGLDDDTGISISMSYAAEEPRFDDEAYTALLNSVRRSNGEV